MGSLRRDESIAINLFQKQFLQAELHGHGFALLLRREPAPGLGGVGQR